MNDKRTAAQPVAAPHVTPRERDKNPPPPPPSNRPEAKPVENGAIETAAPAVEVRRTFTVETPAAAPAPVVIVAGQLTREQKLALFEAAFAAEKEVKKAEEAVKALELVLSDKIKLIIAALDGKQGPWNVLGERDLRARMRGDIAYFLRRDDVAETI
jgi:hypothetical protein